MRRLLGPIAFLTLPIVLLFGIWAGGHPNVLPGFLRDGFVSDSQGRVFDDALGHISRDYYRPVKKDDLLNQGIAAAVASLKDRFSHYYDPKEYSQFEETTTGNFEGVGMTVSQVKQGLKVESVFSGGPAAKAGIEKADLIVAVNGTSLAGKTSDQSTNLIKGPSGTSVKLTISHARVSRVVTVE